jgi:hypothetical protein
MPSPSPTKLAKISNAKFAIDRNVVGFASAIVIIYPVADFTVADIYIADIAFAGIIIDNPTSTAKVTFRPLQHSSVHLSLLPCRKS